MQATEFTEVQENEISEITNWSQKAQNLRQCEVFLFLMLSFNKIINKTTVIIFCVHLKGREKKWLISL